MNRRILVLGVLVVIVSTGVVLLCGNTNQAQPELVTPQRTITAIGTAIVTGTPDTARVHLGIATPGKTVAAAREENARVVGQVHAALLVLKLKEPKTRTTDSRVTRVYAENDRSRLVGYMVNHSFTVLITEPDPVKLATTAGRILDAGLQSGVNEEGQIEFFKADDSELRRQAMTKAVENGLANAQAYAAGAKVKTVGVVEIVGQDEYFRHGGFGGQFGGGFGMQGGGGFGGGAAGPSIVAGVWNVPSQVRVVCRY